MYAANPLKFNYEEIDINMKMKEINRMKSTTEVISIYEVKNQIINLTSRFNNKNQMEDLIFEIILKKLRDPINNIQKEFT